MPDREVLFAGSSVMQMVHEAPLRLLATIEALNDSELQSDVDRDALLDQLLSQHRIAVPVIDVFGISATEQSAAIPAKSDGSGESSRRGKSARGERAVDNEMKEFSFRVPFKGDANIFRARPSTAVGATGSSIAALIEKDALIFQIARPDDSGAEQRSELDRMLNSVDRHLSWLRSDCLGLETILQRTAMERIAARLKPEKSRRE